MWTERAKLEYPGKIETQDQPEFSPHRQRFANCSATLSIRYSFWIDSDTLHNKLQFDSSLNICFWCRFSYIDSQSLSKFKPLQNVNFLKAGNMQIFWRIVTNC